MKCMCLLSLPSYLHLILFFNLNYEAGKTCNHFQVPQVQWISKFFNQELSCILYNVSEKKEPQHFYLTIIIKAWSLFPYTLHYVLGANQKRSSKCEQNQLEIVRYMACEIKLNPISKLYRKCCLHWWVCCGHGLDSHCYERFRMLQSKIIFLYLSV